MKIYTVVISNSYGDFGDSYTLSYHKSEEGAYLRMDKENELERLERVDSFNGTYYYNDHHGRSMCVETISLED